MDPKSRVQVYEDLKDLRRRGELQQVGDVKAALGKLPAAAQKKLKKNGVFRVGDIVIVKMTTAKPLKGNNPSTGGIVMLKAKPARKGVHQRPIKASSRRHELFRVLEIEALAGRVFGDEKKAKAWLRRPNTSMSGQIPLDLMKDELGAAVVREALEQIDHGIFA